MPLTSSDQLLARPRLVRADHTSPEMVAKPAVGLVKRTFAGPCPGPLKTSVVWTMISPTCQLSPLSVPPALLAGTAVALNHAGRKFPTAVDGAQAGCAIWPDGGLYPPSTLLIGVQS